MKSCFFIGHRETDASILPLLTEIVERHVTEYGVDVFYVGNYGNFDRLAAQAVVAVKKHHPQIVLSMLIPYHPAQRPNVLPLGFDNSFYPPGMEKVPRRFAIVRANRYMVEHVEYLISCVWHPASNAKELTEYAKKRQAKGLIAVTELTGQGEGASHPAPASCLSIDN